MNVRRLFLRLATPLVALALVGGSVFVVPDARAQVVPANLRAAILIRALGYEQAFGRTTASATLAVVKGGSGASANDGAAMSRAFDAIVRAGGLSRPIAIREVPWRDAATALTAIQALRPSAVYLPDGVYELATRLASLRGVVVFCENIRGFDQGCAVGVEIDRNAPRLVVNLRVVEQAGLRFDARMLRLSRVIR